MCGFVGWIGPPAPESLVRARDTLIHRGPDDAGVFSDSHVSLGHRRLAILDRPGGRQPMASADGRLVVVFNGEIYNHPALRRELEARGHRYRTRCDTETLLIAYAEWGDAMVNHLDGMFAFVLYDAPRRRLLAARDRMGEKPIFFWRPRPGSDNSLSLAFASEIKALVELAKSRGRLPLDGGALLSYLSHDYVSGDRRIYKHISQLGAGEAAVIEWPEGEDLSIRRWRYLPHVVGAETPDLRGMDGEELAARLREILGASVESRLQADTPLGVFLSGGIDSASIVGTLRRLRPDERIATYSIGFDEPSFDESEAAALVARAFKTDHHHRVFTARDLMARIDPLVDQLDEPFADPSILPVSLLCEFARESITVALGGDGGDELFAGYDPFRALAPARLLRRVTPRAIRERVFPAIADRLPGGSSNMPLGFRLARFLTGVAAPKSVQTATWMAPFAAPALRRLVPDLVGDRDDEAIFAAEDKIYQSLKLACADELERAQGFFEQVYLEGDILVKVDRASMRHSLEVRCPYLSPAMVGFSHALPSEWKIRGGQTKVLLRQALVGMLPKETLSRPKKGFGIPVARWIRGELREEFRQTLLVDWPASLPMFERREIERLFRAHLAGANRYKELWALFILARWARGHL